MQYHECNSGFNNHPWTVDKDQEAVTEALGKNPWSLRQHHREINRMLGGEHIRAKVDLHALLRDMDDFNPAGDRLTEEHNNWKRGMEKISASGELMKGERSCCV